MADPHIESPMDKIDKITVVIYRIGLTLAAPATAATMSGNSKLLFFVYLASAMCAATLHLYVKSIRLLLQATAWIGILIALLGFPQIGLAGAFVTLGGLCFKEQFCFKVPGIQFQPIILAILWISLLANLTLIAKIFAAIATLFFLITSIAKWRMPLHYDIGDKTKYEI